MLQTLYAEERIQNKLKEESLGELNNYCNLDVGDRFLITNLILENFDHFNNILRTDKFSSALSLFKFIALKDENSSKISPNNRKLMPKFHIIWPIWYGTSCYISYFVIPWKDTLLEAFYGNFLTVNNMTTKQWKEAIRQNVRFKCWDGYSQSFGGKIVKTKKIF